MPLLEQIKDAGIVGCGGAGFPTHVKLNCTVEHLIINSAYRPLADDSQSRRDHHCG